MNNEYKIVEAEMFGWKVKCNGASCAQFPKQEMAISYCEKMLSKHKDEHIEIDCVYKNGTTEKIKLFNED